MSDQGEGDFWEIMIGNSSKGSKRKVSAPSVDEDGQPFSVVAAKARGKSVAAKANGKSVAAKAKAKASGNNRAASSCQGAAVREASEIKLFLRQCEDALPAESRATLDSMESIVLGTACSGTDQISMVLKLLAARHSAKAPQYWACEKEEWKRAFISANTDSEDIVHIFEDLTRLADEFELGSTDCISGDTVPIRQVSMVVCCCSCTTLSSLNQVDGNIAPSAVSNAAGATGETVDGLIRLLKRLKPKRIMMENVPQLVKGMFEDETVAEANFEANGPALIRTFGEIDYALAWVTLSPDEVGVPQSRSRVFVVGFHKPQVPDALDRLAHFKERSWEVSMFCILERERERCLYMCFEEWVRAPWAFTSLHCSWLSTV